MRRKAHERSIEMFYINERGNIEIPRQVTERIEITPFLFWQIEKTTYPKFKIRIRRRERDL